MRRWEGVGHLGRTKSGVVLANVGKLRSAGTRKLLLPLADALDSRLGGDARELARSARHLTATRA